MSVQLILSCDRCSDSCEEVIGKEEGVAQLLRAAICLGWARIRENGRIIHVCPACREGLKEKGASHGQ